MCWETCFWYKSDCNWAQQWPSLWSPDTNQMFSESRGQTRRYIGRKSNLWPQMLFYRRIWLFKYTLRVLFQHLKRHAGGGSGDQDHPVIFWWPNSSVKWNQMPWIGAVATVTSSLALEEEATWEVLLEMSEIHSYGYSAKYFHWTGFQMKAQLGILVSFQGTHSHYRMLCPSVIYRNACLGSVTVPVKWFDPLIQERCTLNRIVINLL